VGVLEVWGEAEGEVGVCCWMMRVLLPMERISVFSPVFNAALHVR
jgi:hypothetical protein